MDGIRRHQISLVVVITRRQAYWRPLEDVCFKSLLTAYPRKFELIYSGPDYSVYHVKSGVQQSLSWEVYHREA